MGIQPIRKVVAPEIPDKLYFRIGDVARLCEVPAYVLRFWETEFPQLKPTKGGTGQRLYRRRDVEMALRIKSLLYDQRYTIPGARQVFKDESKAREAVASEAFAPVPIPGEISARPDFAQVVGQKLDPQPRITGMAARTQVSTPEIDRGAEHGSENELNVRRQATLSALREEMRALLSSLGSPGIASSLAAATPMRPRLVLEPRPAAPRGDAPRLEMLRLVREPQRDSAREPSPSDPSRSALNQGDLFQGE